MKVLVSCGSETNLHAGVTRRRLWRCQVLENRPAITGPVFGTTAQFEERNAHRSYKS